jgi:hypothetical protein
MAEAERLLAGSTSEERQRLLDHVRAQLELEVDLAAASPQIPGSVADVLARLGPPADLIGRARATLNLSAGAPPVQAPMAAGLAACRICKQSVAAVAAACPHCGAPRPANQSWNGTGYEYRSAATWRGMPLLHIAVGRDANGRFRVARGVVAVGQFARGVVVVAQVGAASVFGLGQFIAAPIAVAQFAVGLVCVGQIALAALLGVGMLATGLRATGAFALRLF